MSYFVELLAEIASYLTMTIAVASPDGSGIPQAGASVTLVYTSKIKDTETGTSMTLALAKDSYLTETR